MNTYVLIAECTILGLIGCYFLGRSGLVKFKPVELSDNYQLGWINKRIRSPRLGAFRDLTKMHPETDAIEDAPVSVRQPKKVVSRKTTKKRCPDKYVHVYHPNYRPEAVVPDGREREFVAALVAIGYKKGEVQPQVKSFIAANPQIRKVEDFMVEFLKQAKG